MASKISFVRWLTIFLLTAGLLALIVACSGNSDDDQDADLIGNGEETPGQSVENDEDREEVTIRFQNWAQSDTYNRVNEAFMDEFPWINVEWVFSGAGAFMFAITTWDSNVTRVQRLITHDYASGTPYMYYPWIPSNAGTRSARHALAALPADHGRQRHFLTMYLRMQNWYDGQDCVRGGGTLAARNAFNFRSTAAMAR